jgi:hypothetical protein
MTITTPIICKYCKNITGNNIIKVVEFSCWKRMKDNPPTKDGEILFVAKEGITSQRFGTVYICARMVLLRNTDVSFDDIIYWMPIPKPPTSEEFPVA